MNNTFDEINISQIGDIKKRVENNSKLIDEIVDGIIRFYCKDLDNFVTSISEIIMDKDDPPTAQELDEFCLQLSTQIYFASSMSERLGIRDDIGKAVYKEMYHTTRSSQREGTVQDKNSLAELASQQEYITSVCYTRAFKIVKAKVDAAQELLSSIKKVISRRMHEYELTNMGGNR